MPTFPAASASSFLAFRAAASFSRSASMRLQVATRGGNERESRSGRGEVSNTRGASQNICMEQRWRGAEMAGCRDGREQRWQRSGRSS